MPDLNCIKPVPCVPNEEVKEIYPPATPPFNFCAGNLSVSWDGSRLRSEQVRNIPDGEYGTVTVTDGCITGFGLMPAATYTPPYCNPAPIPCGDGSSSGTTPISPEAGNTLVSSTLGLYAKTYIQGDTTITVSGNGTQANPYKLAGATGTGVKKITSGNPHIIINETVPGVPSVGLIDSGITAGIYAGFAVDRFGLITGYNNTSEDVVSDIQAGTDIVVSNVGSTFTIGHTTKLAGNTTVRLGAYDVGISQGGHIETATRQNTVVPGTYAVDGWLITIDSYGAITEIINDPTPLPNPSQAILDIIDIYYNTANDTYSIQGLGQVQPTNFGGNGASYSFTMPSYVIDENQITVIGGGGLSVSFIDSAPVKVQVTSATSAGANIKFVIRGVQ